MTTAKTREVLHDSARASEEGACAPAPSHSRAAPALPSERQTVVLDLWREADKELGITEKLSHIIPDSLEVSFWSKAVKIPLPKVDLSFIVDKVIIPTVVHIANRLGWKSW